MFGEEHPYVATIYNNLGSFYSDMSEYEQALELDDTHAQAWHNLGVTGGGAVKGVDYSEKLKKTGRPLQNP